MGIPDSLAAPAADPLGARLVLDALLELVVAHELVLGPDGAPRDYRILDCNAAFTRVTGIARERAVGRLGSEVYGGAPPYLEVYARVATTGEPARFETYYPPLDRHFGISVVSPRPGAFVTVASDVTERERAARRLADERQRLAVTLHSIGDAVIVTDEAGRVTVMNEVTERLTGWTAADALGRPVHEVFRIVSEDTGAPAPDPVERVLREGVVVGLANHTALVARDGTARPIADSGAPVRGADGRVAGAVLVFRDQTEERAAERAVRASEKRYRDLVDVSPDAILVTRAARIAYVNPACLRLYGAARTEEVEGRSPLDFIHPDYHAAARERIAGVLAGRAAPPVEKRIVRLDGTLRDVEVLAVPFELDGAPAAQVILRDITERKHAQAEGERLQTQLAESLRLESVGQLAGGIAHDFNNILTVILSCAEAIQAGVQAGGAPSAEDVEEIHAAGMRARDLTRQLLAFARKQEITPVPLALNEVVLGMQKMLRRVVREDVQLTVRLQPDLWPVCCDPGQLEQIILNLAVNARDAMPAGGELVVETGNHPAAGHHDGRGDYVRLVVRDTGVGMSDEVKRHLFEPFFTTKPRGQGTGLGLATVYGIVKQSHGHVHVESELGRGTSVEICLPRYAGAAQPVSPAPAAGGGRGTETILVVEDEPQVRGVTVRALRSAGYRVLAAAGGAEALAVVAQEPGEIHLLVTDVIMPELNGRAVATALRAQRPRLAVLFVSGYTQDTIGYHGVLDPGVELLSKPFTAAQLLARVRAVLDAAER